jgi:hypothetical protein
LHYTTYDLWGWNSYIEMTDNSSIWEQFGLCIENHSKFTLPQFVFSPYNFQIHYFDSKYEKYPFQWPLFFKKSSSHGPGENHRPVASHWKTLLNTVVHLVLIENWTHNISDERHWLYTGSCKFNYHRYTILIQNTKNTLFNDHFFSKNLALIWKSCQSFQYTSFNPKDHM